MVVLPQTSLTRTLFNPFWRFIFPLQLLRSKRSKASKLSKLHVGVKTYHGDSVKDGFYDSISNLKSRDWDTLDASEQLSEFSLDYLNILEVCKSGASIPDISEKDSF